MKIYLYLEKMQKQTFESSEIACIMGEQCEDAKLNKMLSDNLNASRVFLKKEFLWGKN